MSEQPQRQYILYGTYGDPVLAEYVYVGQLQRTDGSYYHEREEIVEGKTRPYQFSSKYAAKKRLKVIQDLPDFHEVDWQVMPVAMAVGGKGHEQKGRVDI